LSYCLPLYLQPNIEHFHTLKRGKPQAFFTRISNQITLQSKACTWSDRRDAGRRPGPPAPGCPPPCSHLAHALQPQRLQQLLQEADIRYEETEWRAVQHRRCKRPNPPQPQHLEILQFKALTWLLGSAAACRPPCSCSIARSSRRRVRVLTCSRHACTWHNNGPGTL